MIPDSSPNTDERQSTEQVELPAAQPLPLPPVTPSADLAPMSASPTPPQGRIAARIQQMPPAGRWTLGLGLAFLSGFAMIVAPFVLAPPGFPIYVIFVVMAALALAAGVVLTKWWATLALIAAAVVGGLAGSGMAALLTPGELLQETSRVEMAYGPRGMFTLFAMLLLTPLVLFMLAGVGIGRLHGLGLGPPQALSARERQVSRWIAALAPVIVFGFLAGGSGVLYTFIEHNVRIVLYSVGGLLVSSFACLLAGWVLRSWRAVVAPAAVYVVLAAVNAIMGWIMTRPHPTAAQDVPAMIAGFALLVIVPAVVMSAIGTVIGMRATQRPQRPAPLPQRPPTSLPAT